MQDPKQTTPTSDGNQADKDLDTLSQPEDWTGLPPKIRAALEKKEEMLRELQNEILQHQAENESIGIEYQRQNESLRKFNATLEDRISERTQELEVSRAHLAAHNQEMEELAKSKEEMMHMIVHDMKNPLTAIMGALTLSQNQRFTVSEDLRDLLKGANMQSIKLRAMIDDILTMSKMKTKEIELQKMEVDLVSLIQQSVMMMNTTMGSRLLTLKFIPPPGEIVVNMDFQMIERVINNIINNAMKYAPNGSEILLEVTQDKEFASLHVKNWGEAIPAEFHKKIFEMYGRAKPQDKRVEGTGLGLAFCKLAVEAHGGTLRVESPIPPGDNGAHFVFTLPLCNKPCLGT